MMYVIYVLNRMANGSLGGEAPLFMLTGVRPDISPLLRFRFYEPVYFATAEVLSYSGSPGFPSESKEGKGRFVGFGESVGDVLTFKVLTDDTNKIIYRSAVRSAVPENARNWPLDPFDGEGSSKPIHEVVRSPSLIPDDPKDNASKGPSPHIPIYNPDELINRTFLIPGENGEKHRATIVRKIIEHNHDVENNPEHVNFFRLLTIKLGLMKLLLTMTS